MTRLRLGLVVVFVLAAGPLAAAPPNLVFLLLDTTRADRLSAWGNPRPTTPNLDALAHDGVRFARHFANSHATRPSMPQLMSGRYYEASVLREFRPRTHPRDWPFAAPDPTFALLPEILTGAGYHLAAVSAHPWVSRASRLGAPFDVFEEPDVPAERGHADAAVLVDRGLALWRERPHDRPFFLYLHFMDAHIPRHVPPGALRFGREDPVARAHFDAAGEPHMDDPWHEWDRSDARAFTAADVAFFTAVYDTVLAHLDAEIGRLVAGIRLDDPGLARTVIVVVADHGEELGEHGRISHEDSLDDAVQHVPWIVAGGPVATGQTVWGVTENVDVVPTVLGTLGVSPPERVHFDGRSMLHDGRPCTACTRARPVYAWEDYRGIRLGKTLVRQELPGSLAARCRGRNRLLAADRRSTLSDPPALHAGIRLLARTLDGPEARFHAGRFDPARRPFSVLARFWRLGAEVPITCVDAGPTTPRRAFDARGWIWTGRGVTVLHDAAHAPPLPLVLEVPDGDYDVTLAVRALAAPPRFFGYDRWLRKRLRRRKPTARIALGSVRATGGRARVDVPPSLLSGQHLLALDLRPHGAPAETEKPQKRDHDLHERLRRLGYVE
jgi:arylsulfatase A-like enzyme